MSKFVSAWANEEEDDLILVDEEGNQAPFYLSWKESFKEGKLFESDSGEHCLWTEENGMKKDLTGYENITEEFLREGEEKGR